MRQTHMASLRIPVTLKNLLRARSAERNMFLAEFLESLLIRDMQQTTAEKMRMPIAQQPTIPIPPRA